MVTHLNLSSTVKNKDNETSKLHFMPCIIKTDGKAEVSKYFEPLIVKRDDGVLRASFRGFPLLGKEVPLPEHYRGVVLIETNERLSEEAERNLYGSASFDKFTYWNWDVEPSGNDKVIMAMEWLDIAEAGMGKMKSIYTMKRMLSTLLTLFYRIPTEHPTSSVLSGTFSASKALLYPVFNHLQVSKPLVR